jgi:hypothetical protein
VYKKVGLTPLVRVHRPVSRERHKEHVRYIRSNNPTSAYATHILHNGHEYGTAKTTLQLLKHCQKGIEWISGNQCKLKRTYSDRWFFPKSRTGGDVEVQLPS